MEKKPLIEAGRIINTHGIHGEVKIEVWVDSPQFLASFKRIVVEPDEEFQVLSAKTFKGFVIAGLKGLDDINAAMKYKGKVVYIRREDAHLPSGSFFLQDIIGIHVVDEDGNNIGVLSEILETPSSMVYVVKGEQERLIPAVPEFILKTDLEGNQITVHLIEGM